MGVMEERFLDRLQQSRTRCAIGAVTFVATLVGGICYFPFTSALILSVEPTPTSPSGVAHRIYAQYFPPEPVQLLVLVKSRDGSPLIPHVNSTLEPEQPRALERWVAAPPPTPLTAEAAQVSHELSGVAARELDVHCRYTFLSYFDIGLKKSHEGRHDRPIHDVLDGIISRVARPMLFDSDASRTLMLVQIEACHGEDMTAEIVGKNEASAPVVSAMEALKDYADAYPASSGLAVERVSFPGVMATVQEGVETAMLLSTLTAIPAFVLLGVFFKNLRLLIITLINIAFCVATSVLIMYPVSLSMKVSAEAPAMMVATGLAMSIDYSLFILTRFGEEKRAGASVKQALLVTLQTSGHTVFISGSTLCLCFLGMLLIPVSTISTMGLAAAFTVLFAIVGGLTITPALLLSFPDFFTADRRLGLSADGIALFAAAPKRLAGDGSEPMLGQGQERASGLPWSPAADAPAVQPLEAATAATAAGSAGSHSDAGSAAARPWSLWASVGRLSQRGWLVVVPLLVGVAVPFVIPLLDFEYIEGLQTLLPRGDPLTETFLEVQDHFGVSQIFPNTIVVLPPNPGDVTSRGWLNASCHAMKFMASNVTEVMRAHGREAGDASLQNFAMKASDFSGLMIQGGICTSLLISLLENPLAKKYGDFLVNGFSNEDRTATKVRVKTTLDPFSTVGQKWIAAVRDAMAASEVWVSDPSFPGDTTVLGEMHLTGMAQEQMDGAADTFASLPRVIGATLLIVMAVLGSAFRSAVVPLRAVLCLSWMLLVTFGLGVLVYQHGVLQSLGIRPFLTSPDPPAHHAMYWMTPCIAFSILVGLGLDYDVFFMESVVEHFDAGYSSREAVVEALRHTGTIICVAGVIMFLAFGSLLIGASPMINQLAFHLCVGVLIDCFVTTKVIIPCAMAMLDLLPGNANFWPRKPPPALTEPTVEPLPPLRRLGSLRNSLSDNARRSAMSPHGVRSMQSPA